MIISMNRVLVVAAHPDDEVLGCGATIKRLADEGSEVFVLILGEGSSCRYPFEKIKSSQSLKAIAQRQNFAEKALALLGVEKKIFGDLPCGRFDCIPVIDITKKIEACIDSFQPDTVFTHYACDANSDHRLVFDAVIAATRPIPGRNVKNVLSFEIPSSSEWRFIDTFQPNLFIDIEKYIDSKVSAFNFYAPTEEKSFPFPRCEEGLRTIAHYRGMQSGLFYAEAFQIIRAINSI